MRNSLIIAIIASHLVITAVRLPKWDNDKSIWVAAVEVDSLDPWNLNNAAHYAHKTDPRAKDWLISFLNLEIPDWLPFNEREPYRVGIEGLRDTLRESGFTLEADKVNNKWNEIMIGHKIVMEYVAK